MEKLRLFRKPTDNLHFNQTPRLKFEKHESHLIHMYIISFWIELLFASVFISYHCLDFFKKYFFTVLIKQHEVNTANKS